MSLLNRLEDTWKALDRITAEVCPSNGPLGRSGCSSEKPEKPEDPETVKLLNDIIRAAVYIRHKLKP